MSTKQNQAVFFYTDNALLFLSELITFLISSLCGGLGPGFYVVKLKFSFLWEFSQFNQY